MGCALHLLADGLSAMEGADGGAERRAQLLTCRVEIPGAVLP